MLIVTEGAKQELRRILASANIDDPEVGLRLVASATREFSLKLDKEHEGDQVVEHEGAKVLLVGREVSQGLEGVTVDCRETSEGTRLTIYRGEKPSREESQEE